MKFSKSVGKSQVRDREKGEWQQCDTKVWTNHLYKINHKESHFFVVVKLDFWKCKQKLPTI